MAGEQLLPWIDSGDAEGNRNSMQNFEGDGIITSWDFNFAGGYISTADVKAYIYRTASGLTDAIDPVVLTGPNTIEVIPAVPDGDFLVVYRDTPKDMPLVDYTTGAVLDEANLDKSNKQAVFVAAEMSDRFDAINASSADAIARSFEALTIANAADDKADIAIADSANAVATAAIAEATAANALDIAEDAVAAAAGFQTDIQLYEANDTTPRGLQWQLGSVALPGNKRWFAGVDAGSDFTLNRHDNAGAFVDAPIKVQRSTGNIILTAKQIKGLADGTSAQDAATKAQVDAASAAVTAEFNAQKIDKDGTLDFTAHQKLFNSAPTDPLHAASKGYVDALRPGVKLLATGAYSTGVDTWVVFDNLAANPSEMYEILVSDLTPNVDNSTLSIQFSYDNGATWVTTTNYSAVGQRLPIGGAAIVSSSTNTSALVLFGGVSNAAGRCMGGLIRIFKPLNSARTKQVNWELSGIEATGTHVLQTGSGGLFGVGTTAVNAVRIGFSGPGIASGVFKLYARN